MQKNHKTVHFEIPTTTHKKLEDYARNIGDISNTNRPKVATAIRRTLRVILNFYANEEFQEKCLKNDEDMLSFLKKCIRKEMEK